MTEAAKREEVKIGRRINHGMAANHDVIVASFPCARVSAIVALLKFRGRNKTARGKGTWPPRAP
jgi:hypothetical protein